MLMLCCSNKGEDEMVEYFQNKYSGESVARILGDGEDMSDEITQQGLLPGVKWVCDGFALLLLLSTGHELDTDLRFHWAEVTYSIADVNNVHSSWVVLIECVLW